MNSADCKADLGADINIQLKRFRLELNRAGKAPKNNGLLVMSDQLKNVARFNLNRNRSSEYPAYVLLDRKAFK